MTCSPTSTALDLSARRDGGYFVRTIGSEAFEAAALTEAMIDTGRQNFAVLYPEDDYGLAYATEMQRAFRRRREERRAGPLRHDAAAVQRTGDSGARRRVSKWSPSSARARSVPGCWRRWPPTTRRPARSRPSSRPGCASTTSARSSIPAVRLPRRASRACHRRPDRSTPCSRRTSSRASPGGRMAYAAYAYDCVNLLALAAQAAGSDDAEEVQAEITSVSAGGSTCRRFGPCAELLAEGRSINLNGASGDLDLQDDGDVGVADYDVFEYDEQGQDMSTGTITIRLDSSVEPCLAWLRRRPAGRPAASPCRRRTDRTRRRRPRPGRSASCRRPP